MLAAYDAVQAGTWDKDKATKKKHSKQNGKVKRFAQQTEQELKWVGRLTPPEVRFGAKLLRPTPVGCGRGYRI